MATIPGTTTATVGQVLTASFWNTEVRDMADFLLNRPMGAVNRSSNQSISDATDTAVQWNAEDFDLPSAEAAHDNSSNPSRYTVKTAGKFFVAASVQFAANATGGRDLWFSVNGANAYYKARLHTASASANSFVLASGLLPVSLVVNDYIEVFVRQSSGGALNVSSGSYFSAIWMGIRWRSHRSTQT